MAKYESFSKTLLIINNVSEIIINDWNAISKDMLVGKSNKCSILIVKVINNLRQFFF